jgi:TolB-like protein
LVGKDELMAQLWPSRIVEEGNLHVHVSALRKTLGEHGDGHSYIVTVPGRGYLLAGLARPPSADDTTTHTPQLLPLPDKPSIAVMPFVNLTGDTEQEYFADGIVEEITTAIARFPSLFVIARNSSFTYKGKAIDVREVGRTLGVRYVLEGSVRKLDNRVRITSQLIDALTGAHVSVNRFDATLDDIFAIQEQVASSVAGTIEPRLRLAEIQRATRKPTNNLDAYDLYLRGLALSYERTRESLAESIRLAHRALELDPSYALAMAKVAIRRHLQRARNWIPPSGAEVDEGIAMARQALALAMDDSDVLDAAGVALAWLAGENETALAVIDRAIALNPNLAIAFGHRASILAWQLNQGEEAIQAAQQGRRLSPNDPVAFTFSMAQCVGHLMAGRCETALVWADQALSENAGAPALRLRLSLCGHLRRLDEAGDCLRRLCENHPDPTIAKLISAFPKGVSEEVTARLAAGYRKAGLPED